MNVTKFIDHTDSVRVGRVDGNRLIPLNLGSSFHSLADLLAADDPIAAVGSLTEESPLLIDDSIRWLPPIDQQEVWAAGVTYKRSQTARMEESEAAASCYDRVYNADRPELFFKANPHRVSGHGQPLRIRKDATWNVPEPEVTLVLSPKLRIVGLTIGNDMSSRDIEGENPLYLPQAKCYDGSCALGPCLYVSPDPLPASTQIELEIRRGEQVAFAGSVAISQIRRKFEELASYLFREMSFPFGCLLMTGTGVVPPNDFTLRPGDEVLIRIDPIGTLANRVES